jgi:hypothetical protein
MAKERNRLVALEGESKGSKTFLTDWFLKKIVDLIVDDKAKKANKKIDKVYKDILKGKYPETELTDQLVINVNTQINDEIGKRTKLFCGELGAAEKDTVKQELKKLMAVYNKGVAQEHFTLRADQKKYKKCCERAALYGSKSAKIELERLPKSKSDSHCIALEGKRVKRHVGLDEDRSNYSFNVNSTHVEKQVKRKEEANIKRL